MRLPPEYHRALDTVTIPAMSDLQNAVGDLIGIYQKDFQFVFPALNWKILLFEWIERMALPIEIYSASKRLVEILKFDFTYSLPQEKSSKDKGQQRRFRKTAIFWPEAQLISILVVATKLLFPFPLTALPSGPYIRSKHLHLSAPTSDLMKLSWSDWLSLHRADDSAKAQQHAIAPGKEMEVHDTDILEMSDDAIDAYMDWYQQMFTVPDTASAPRQTDFERTVLNMFPLVKPHDTPRSRGTQNDQLERMLCQKVQTEALLPGEENTERIYPVFSSVEQLETMNTRSGVGAELNPILLFHQTAADTACMDRKSLLDAVRYSERKLEKWFEEMKKNASTDDDTL